LRNSAHTNARCADVVLSAWFRPAQLGVSYQRTWHMPHLGAVWAFPPNQRLQLTPLRGPKIEAFLKLISSGQ
jgi:hypothetical protein